MTEMEKVLRGGYEAHGVGSYNSDVMDTYGNGVTCGEDIDNFTLVEIVYSATGEETCVSLTDATHEGLLVCTPEVRHFAGEKMDSFFNAKGEKARVAYLAPNKRFQTSAFAKADNAKEIVQGQKVYFDVATKKYVVQNGEADEVEAFNKFVVQQVGVDTLSGHDVIMLKSVAK